MHQENDGFSPIAIVLETKHELEIFWDIMIRTQKSTYQNDEYKMAGEMAGEISDYLSNKAHL